MANEQNPYLPSPVTGPFADAINPNVVSQPHQSNLQFNGYDTKTGAILGIASKVLAGIGQGRAQRAVAKEKEQAQRLQNYTQTAQWIMANPDIDPAQKAKFGQDFQAALLPMVAGAAKDSGADKHPVGGAFLNILKGVAGGDIKSPKYDFKGIDQVMANYAHLGKTPGTTVTGQTQAADGQFRQAISAAAQRLQKAGQQPTEQAIMQDPGVQQAQQGLTRFHGGPKGAQDYAKSVVGSMFQSAPALQAPPRPGTQEAARENYLKQFGPGTPPPAASAPQGAPPQASIPPASSVNDSLISPGMRKRWEGTVTPPYTDTGNTNGPGSLKTRTFRDSPAGSPPAASAAPQAQQGGTPPPPQAQESQPPAPEKMSVDQWSAAQAAGYIKEPVTKRVDGKLTNLRFVEAPGATGWYTVDGKRVDDPDGTRVTDANVQAAPTPKTRNVNDGKGNPVIEQWNPKTEKWEPSLDSKGKQAVPWERATKSQKDTLAPFRLEVVRAQAANKSEIDRLNQTELKAIQDIRKAQNPDGSPKFSDKAPKGQLSEQAKRIQEVQANYAHERERSTQATKQLIDNIAATNNIVTGALLDHEDRVQLGMMPTTEADEDRVMGDPNQF